MAPALSLSEALDSRSCAQPGCIFDAEPGSEFCAEHPRRGPRQLGEVTPERLELARRAADLRGRGLTYDAIAVTLGISRNYANDLVLDPDGAKSRARKDRYRQPCPKCGELMTGGDGVTGAPAQCKTCAAAALHDDRYWTRERIIETFQAFHAKFGRTPAVSDKSGSYPSQRSHFSPQRLAEIDAAVAFTLPIPWIVAREFGSWKKAVEAAGLKQRPTGGPGHRGRIPSPALLDVFATVARGIDTPRDVARERHTGAHCASKQLSQLVDEGLLVRVGYGRYAVAPGATPTRLQGGAMARQFTVFTRNGVGWVEADGIVEALNGDLAIEQVAKEAGEYVAVETRLWQPVPVGPVNRLAVIRDTPAA